MVIVQITAKFASVCPKCSEDIRPGATVEWSREAPATHVRCPEVPAGQVGLEEHFDIDGADDDSPSYPTHDGAIFRKGAGFLRVVSCNRRMERGDEEDERIVVYRWKCVPATDAESAPLIATAEARHRHVHGKCALAKLFNEIQKGGEFPKAAVADSGPWPTGTTVEVTDLLQTLVVESDGATVWAIRHNGRDGDTWANNNISGAMARRMNAPEIATEILRLTGKIDPASVKREEDARMTNIIAAEDEIMRSLGPNT